MRRWYFAGGCLLLITSILCACLYFMPEKDAVTGTESRIAAELEKGHAKTEENPAALTSQDPGKPDSVSPGYEASGPAPDPGESGKEGAGDGNYTSPVDFEALQALNPDIYAWLYIPGSDISYPLLQSAADDTFYLNHDSSGKESKNGALFTEHAYNGREFTDPVTVVYGHHMRSGAMFGRLQALYSAPDGLETYRELYVYLPDGEQRYEAFAATPFDNDHILHYYDFSSGEAYRAFFGRLGRARQIGARTDGISEISPGDQILILSTCLSGNNKKRYLVLAKRAEDE